jgi:hypothetical protein
MESAQHPRDDFVTRVRQALGDTLKVADDLLIIGHDIAATPSTDPLPETVRQLLQTLSNSMRSVVILVEHGCGTDAFKIARTMFETAVNIHYLDSHPEAIQDYIDFQWIKKKRYHNELKKYAPAQAQRLDDASLNELNAEYARVSPRFTGPKRKIRSQWHKSDHREVARSVGAEIIYSGFYPFVSSLTHMDILGLIIARYPSGEVEAVPSLVHLESGLQNAVLTYAMALDAPTWS